MMVLTALLGLVMCLLVSSIMITHAQGFLERHWRGRPTRATAKLPPAPPPHVQKAEVPVWGGPGLKNKKRGAGILFFAYGNSGELSYFLGEAVAAARSCRTLNPSMRIGIVSNNATVDAALFDEHVKPRVDLVFAGDESNGGQNRADGVRRQWLTRLYYLAHSPFEITWALDSNVACCTPQSADGFLRAALSTKLWGYDMVHASQRDGALYPHNWNFVYRWTPETAGLMAEWLQLQLQRGITADDQGTLLIAQTRHRAIASKLHVGQMSTPLATAFHDVAALTWVHKKFGSWWLKTGIVNASSNSSSSSAAAAARPLPPSSGRGDGRALASTPPTARGEDRPFRADGARISRILRGPAHMIHTKDPSVCARVNAKVARPMSPMAADSEGRPMGPSRQLLTRFRRPAANYSDGVAMQRSCERDVGGEACELLELNDGAECERTLSTSYCPFRTDVHARYLVRTQTARSQQTRADVANAGPFASTLEALLRVVEAASTPPPPPPPATEEEREIARMFGTERYEDMNVVFQPPYEPLKALPKMELQLQRSLLEQKPR